MSLTRKQRSRRVSDNQRRYIKSAIIEPEIRKKFNVSEIVGKIDDLITEIIKEDQADNHLDVLDKCRYNILDYRVISNSSIKIYLSQLGFKLDSRSCYIVSASGIKTEISGVYYAHPKTRYYLYEENGFMDVLLNKADKEKLNTLKDLFQSYVELQVAIENERKLYTDSDSQYYLYNYTTWGQIERDFPKWAEELVKHYFGDGDEPMEESKTCVDDKMEKLRNLELRLGL